LTLAGLLDAIPIEYGQQDVPADLEMLFDVTKEWGGKSALEATEYMHKNYVHQTKHMAKLNPGYDVHHMGGNVHKNLTNKNPDTRFMDFSVREKMFTFFLINGCIKGTPEHKMTETIVNNNPWAKPITVYGYDDTWGILGDPFEAETLCVEEHNMGQVASVGVSNLGFFTR
jgi:hypothetical protein